MSMVKRLERFAKGLLALLAGAVLWRPGAHNRAQRALVRPRRVLVVRIDDRVGEALLTTPVLATLKDLNPRPEVHALVHPHIVRVLAGHPAVDRVIPWDRRCLILGAWAPGIRPLRRERYDVIIDCTNWTDPSVTAAIISRLAGPRSAVIGPAAWPVSALHGVAVAPRPDTRLEVAQRVHLLSPLEGYRPTQTLSFRRPEVSPALRSFLQEASRQAYAVVNPGGRLPWRKTPTDVFAAAARVLLGLGMRPVVTWGPGEEPMAKTVVALSPGSVLAPATDLNDLAALLQNARLCVCNNTGPMHLSVAVGTPTLALFLHMDAQRWGHPYPPHLMLDVTPWTDNQPQMLSRVEQEVKSFAAHLGPHSDSRH
jgi:ADP-heptose:LPS heptosyltransferase